MQTQYHLAVYLKVDDGYDVSAAEKANVKVNNKEAAGFTNPCTGNDADLGDMKIEYDPAKVGTLPHNVRVSGGNAYTDNAGENPITAALPGQKVYLIPDIPTGMRLDGWTVAKPSSGVELSETSPAYFIMPDTTVWVSAEFSELSRGWNQVDGLWYYLDPTDGYMWTSGTVDGWTIGSDGIAHPA